MVTQRQPTRGTTKRQAARRPTDAHAVVRTEPGGTRRAAAASPGRGARPAATNQGLIIGACAGGAALLLLAFYFGLSGSPAKAAVVPARKTAEQAPMSVDELVRAAEAKCQEGLGLIQSCGTPNRELGSDREDVKRKLKDGVRLIREGMDCFNQAAEKAGQPVGNVRTEYGEARKLANSWLANIGG